MTLTKDQIEQMRAAAMPLMIWLLENCHPHVQAIVDSGRVEIVEGLATAIRIDLYPLEEKPILTS